MSEPKVTIHVCYDVVYLAVRRDQISQPVAKKLLAAKARELDATPQDYLIAGILGDSEPTLYVLRTKRNETTETKEIAA